MLLDDVRDALAERAQQVGVGSVPANEVLTRARRTVRRRRVARVVGAGTLVVALVSAVVVISTNRSSSPQRIVVAEPTTTTTTVAQSTPGITAAQIDAHLGIGVPKGWVPVDWGDARLFVPPNWILESGGECIQQSNAPGLITAGPTSCESQPGTPADWVRIIVRIVQPGARSPHMVHGYGVVDDEPFNVIYSKYDVPALGVTILMRGSLQTKILDTLAPSAAKVALAAAAQSVPNGHVVYVDGVRMAIPVAWPVNTPGQLPCDGLVSPPEVSRIAPNIVVPPCAAPLPLVVGHVRDGMLVYLPKSPLAPAKDGTRVAVLHHGDSTISVFAEANNANVLDIFVQKAGSDTEHVLTLGLGLDGRVAGGVLASLAARS